MLDRVVWVALHKNADGTYDVHVKLEDPSQEIKRRGLTKAQLAALFKRLCRASGACS